jgi:hypothetical protein
MQAIIDEDVVDTKPPEPAITPGRPELFLASVDLTDEGLSAGEDDATEEPEDAREHTPGMVDKNPEIGFYQRRLAGLRDRLEKSGHPPE